MSKYPRKRSEPNSHVLKAPDAGSSRSDTEEIENGANGPAPPLVTDAAQLSDAMFPDSQPEQRNALVPVSIDELQVVEREAIRASRELLYNQDVAISPYLTGLSLSGGGIRSACFNLGLLEGFDRLRCDYTLTEKLKPTGDQGGRHNHLELFDYISSVSGGSYAAGHLATAMLPPNASTETDPGKKSETPEWFGKVPLTSKTVPGWLWGVGAWFLGVALQLLKTGSLLLCILALLAFVMRTLDSRDAIMLCEVIGLESDVARAFVPFWFTLGIFFVAQWFSFRKWRSWITFVWIGSAIAVVAAYVGIITLSLWSRDYLWLRDNFLFFRSNKVSRVDDLSPLSFVVQYFLLMALPRWCLALTCNSCYLIDG
jgi:hypothetical protein